MVFRLPEEFASAIETVNAVSSHLQLLFFPMLGNNNCLVIPHESPFKDPAVCNN